MTDERDKPRTRTSQADASARQAALVIALVASESMFQRILIRSLQGEFEVLPLDRAEDAIKLVKENLVSAVLIDDDVPETSTSLVRAVKALDPQFPVLLLTGNPKVQKFMMEHWGPGTCLEKPLSPSELRRTVREITRRPELPIPDEASIAPGSTPQARISSSPERGTTTVSWSRITAPSDLVLVAADLLRLELAESEEDEIVFDARCVGITWDLTLRLCAERFGDHVSHDELWGLLPRAEIDTWLSMAIQLPSFHLFASATDRFDDAISAITAEPDALRRVIDRPAVSQWIGDADTSALAHLRQTYPGTQDQYLRAPRWLAEQMFVRERTNDDDD